MREHPAGRLDHRLDDDGADLAALALQQRPQLGHDLGGAPGPGLARLEHAGGRHLGGLQQDRAVGVVEQVDAADADGAEGVAVVALGHVGVQRPLLAALGGRLEGHLQRGLDRRGPVAGVEDPGEPLGRRGQQPLGEGDAGLVGQPEVRRVGEPVELGPTAWSISGTRWPCTVTHSEEKPSR